VATLSGNPHRQTSDKHCKPSEATLSGKPQTKQRALRFVVQVLRGVATGGSSMASVIAAAYDGTLGLHHGVLARGAFRLAALSAPSRADFLCCIVAIPGVIVGEAHLTGELMRVAYEANAFLADVDQFLVNEGVEEPWVI
jgi:hypothetical protein